MSTQQKDIREISETMVLTDNNGNPQLRIAQKISRELNLPDKFEKANPDEDVLVRQRTDPENPDRIVLEVV